MNLPCFRSLVLTAAGLPGLLSAQNLVPNGGFEDYVVCPGGYSQAPAEFRVPHWRSVNSGSPDYFNSCSNGEAGVPYNWAGISDAFEGNGYAGIYTWMSLAKEYREYLHCKLNDPLVRDSLYHVEFRYKLSSYSKYCTDRIGLLISDSVKTSYDDRPLKLEPTFTFVKDSALTLETGSWEIASAEYRAKGNEQFLTIGNFSTNGSTHVYHIRFRPDEQPMLVNSAYYYIDDVSVTPVFPWQPPEKQELLFAGEEPRLNTVYVLENIQFEFNSYALMPVSYSSLDKVVRYLLERPDLKVRLSGHTDDVGSAEYNAVLSSRRAKSAAAYLVAEGIAEERVTTHGYGESRPLTTENGKSAREVNRRVEIEFYR
ncbi:MAG TPA: OmpA family protein [Chryseosolibacter sp.]